MLTLNYYVEITATPQRVWRVLTDAELYKRWAQAFSPQSQFEGEWEEGSDISFFDPDMGGTRAVIDSVQPLHRLEFHHVAIFNPDNRQQLDADIAAKWIGSREIYQIDTEDERLLLNITIHTHSDFVSMFNNGWEKALPLIKSICEETDSQ
ncbi:TPA: SRPBCC domain-containing protein [Vibrio parahaemolyticus]|uniref:SRPBCC family protein n=1 Tax=Vibrio parahaemolyticus TaxID=670 RepID=UPI00084A4A0A|nr:SRPBCC domain-containing protein [Vibrio parahaemolyticus]MCC3814659.1 SRPBCC domain-containing protein [Vibrio parahaemolyticus]MCC3851300.1 SRPBCC domain-containing protein [Vibrio parahaemolyticus]ODY27426.1 2-keto-3-deoxygluconate kinase [Vibrio parahaemolyticus]HAS6832590.1 SRPBCC domain-containing protein [Vibrio parahaemolyticus]HAS6940420.1 SRPBCC domain-containing protein [Vibrio parahaemolyticus]